MTNNCTMLKISQDIRFNLKVPRNFKITTVFSLKISFM